MTNRTLVGDAETTPDAGGAETSGEPNPLPVGGGEVNERRGSVARLESRLAHHITASKREQESLLKLVIGMAAHKYGFDYNATRGRATAAIAADLRLAGVPLDEATILKYLRLAAELLPAEG